jgi:hypothetical protein
MRASTLLLAVLSPLAFFSCRVSPPPDMTVPTAEEPIPTPGTSVEESAPTNPPCAILLSESNLEFAKDAPWTKGPAAYADLIHGLKAALEHKGVQADVLSEDDLASDRICSYRVLYVADTFSITAEAEEGIRHFVQNGGVLVGINEVGRVQGSWTKPWHFEDVFGIHSLPADQFETSVSRAQDLFGTAQTTPQGLAHPLTAGLGPQIDFGPACQSIWAAQPSTATALAVFPRYVKNEAGSTESAALVEEPVVAVSVNDFGKGKAVFVSVDMHDRDPANWELAGATLGLLARCAALAPERLRIPPRPPTVFLGLSQIGYAPGEKKKAILRVPRQDAPPFTEATYLFRDESSGEVLLSGDLAQEGPDNPWRDFYYIADLTPVTREGIYRFTARLAGPRGEVTVQSGPIRIGSNLWSSLVVPAQYSFFHDYRCGETCHLTDPIRGGYHDATGDYAVRMWSMPHVAYGIAENLLASSALPEGPGIMPREELQRAVDWLLAMQDAHGSVWKSVKPPDDMSPHGARPDRDTTRRVLEKGETLNYVTTYVAGMAHASMALRRFDPERAARALAAAEKTWRHLSAHPWKSETSGEIGNFLWGSVELYNATGNAVYREMAVRLAPELLERQFAEPAGVVAGLLGDFPDGSSGRDFGSRQYKKFHTLGLYLGLVELQRTLPHDDPIQVHLAEALETYFNGHLLKGAALTPYGQMITALEPGEDATFRVFFFTHLKSWVRLHGLNVDHLALALVALKYADRTDRDDLRHFARAQAQWVAGANPLGYCMIDFVGWTNCPALDDAVGTGRIPGGIPNGIVGDAHDRPAWGGSWDSREYWIPHNAYLLAVAPHLDAADRKAPARP